MLFTILQFVAASMAEAELGALFMNTLEGKIMRHILQDLDFPQPPAPIHCINTTVIISANNIVKR